MWYPLLQFSHGEDTTSFFFCDVTVLKMPEDVKRQLRHIVCKEKTVKLRT